MLVCVRIALYTFLLTFISIIARMDHRDHPCRPDWRIVYVVYKIYPGPCAFTPLAKICYQAPVMTSNLIRSSQVQSISENQNKAVSRLQPQYGDDTVIAIGHQMIIFPTVQSAMIFWGSWRLDPAQVNTYCVVSLGLWKPK